MPGRKRIPDRLKVISGTARPHRINHDQPSPENGVAIVPEHLSARGAEIFARLSASIFGMGIASPDDVDNLAMLSQRIEMVEVLTVTIEDVGYTYKTDAGLWRGRPEVTMRAEAMRHAQSLLAEFGLSPAARSKVSAGKKPTENPFAGLGLAN